MGRMAPLLRVTGRVVAANSVAKTLIIISEYGKSSTTQVEGDAVKMLAGLKPGDQVALMCRENDKGEHEAITGIKVIS